MLQFMFGIIKLWLIKIFRQNLFFRLDLMLFLWYVKHVVGKNSPILQYLIKQVGK